MSAVLTFWWLVRRRRAERDLGGGASCADHQLFDTPDLDLRLIRKAEAVIQWRSSGLQVVVERCTNDHNHSAILRTAEALGIQHVHIIDPPTVTNGMGLVVVEGCNKSQQQVTAKQLSAHEQQERQQHRLFAQNATEWLQIHEYASTQQCLEQLRREGFAVWATDLSQEAVALPSPQELQQLSRWQPRSNNAIARIPDKLAIVFGTEAVGCTQEMLDGADLRVYLPLRGFADSLNLSVAAALVLHHLILSKPTFVGDMLEEERRQLRQAWFGKLASQRILTAKEKKQRRKLQVKLMDIERLQAKQRAGESLFPEQARKLVHKDELQREWDAMEKKTQASSQITQEWVDAPPAPLSDLRRHDEHRVTFVGKNTKKFYQDHWKGMPAVEHAQSREFTTAQTFRDRMKDVEEKKD